MAENNTRNQRDSRRRREEAHRRRERQLRARMIILAVFVLLAGGIAIAALRIHTRNVKEQEAAAAASRQIAEEQAAAEASRKAADEAAAAEASRKAAEEAAAAEASRKAAEEAAAAEASRKAAEEAAAAAAESKNPAEASTDYSFKAAENIAEIPEEVESSYALLVNVDNGTVVAGRDYDTQMNPASMTKILTLLVAVENIDLSKLDTDTEEITQEIANYRDHSGDRQLCLAESDESGGLADRGYAYDQKPSVRNDPAVRSGRRAGAGHIYSRFGGGVCRADEQETGRSWDL